MFKRIFYFILLLFCLLSLVSCIQEEALNQEADIEYCIVSDKSVLLLSSDSLFKVSTENNDITITVKKNADLTHLAPDFILTKGATVVPVGGSVFDFSNEQKHTYTVTSEDGKWSKTYTLMFLEPTVSTFYHFENSELVAPNNKFYQFFELKEDGSKNYLWSSGNSGYSLAKPSDLPENYPTVPYANGKEGQCLKLETKSTGDLGAMVNMRIAPGNCFIGVFDISKALTSSLQATVFGFPFAAKPKKLKGWYQYQSGAIYQDQDGNEVVGKKDSCDIYAVFYENTETLNGTNVLTSPSIVAVARIDNSTETTEWKSFELAFVYLKEIDETKLANYEYSLTIVFSSSLNGGSFSGAVGSTLLIDEVELLCE